MSLVRYLQVGYVEAISIEEVRMTVLHRDLGYVLLLPAHSLLGYLPVQQHVQVGIGRRAALMEPAKQ
jgi:hypothetical protein